MIVRLEDFNGIDCKEVLDRWYEEASECATIYYGFSFFTVVRGMLLENAHNSTYPSPYLFTFTKPVDFPLERGQKVIICDNEYRIDYVERGSHSITLGLTKKIPNNYITCTRICNIIPNKKTIQFSSVRNKQNVNEYFEQPSIIYDAWLNRIILSMTFPKSLGENEIKLRMDDWVLVTLGYVSMSNILENSIELTIQNLSKEIELKRPLWYYGKENDVNEQ